MTVQRLIATLAVAVLAQATAAHAQGAFPAPLPGQTSAPAASPFPPVNGMTGQPITQPASPSAFSSGAAPVTGGFGAPPPQAAQPNAAMEECGKRFVPLRKEAEDRANAIKAAGKRHAPPQEACKLIAAFSQAELRMIKFVETNTQKCNIPAQLGEQLRKGHANTEQLQTKVCAIAEQAKRGPPGPSLSEALGSAALPDSKPTKRSGGSTFDTLSGNVLAR